jgi:spermidine synthase
MGSPHRWLLFLLFFISGFSSLLYQAVWTRMAFASFGIFIDDGRRYLKRISKKFDVVATGPPPPVEAAGSSLLYSEEFYELVKQHLKPNGIIQVWFPGGQAKTAQAILRSIGIHSAMSIVSEGRTERGSIFWPRWNRSKSAHRAKSLPRCRRQQHATSWNGIHRAICPNIWDECYPRGL